MTRSAAAAPRPSPELVDEFRGRLARESEEERAHCLREALGAFAVGAGIVIVVTIVLVGLLGFLFGRFIGTDAIRFWIPFGTFIGFLGSIALSWLADRPFDRRDDGPRDPRFGPPSVKHAGRDGADDDPGLEPADQHPMGLLMSLPSMAALLVGFGGRHVVQGFRWLFDRSRRGEAPVAKAAELVGRCVEEGSLQGSSLPRDPVVLDGLALLWRHHYLVADGRGTTTRLRPSDKALRKDRR
jgi:hypothetical protein